MIPGQNRWVELIDPTEDMSAQADAVIVDRVNGPRRSATSMHDMLAANGYKDYAK